MRKRVVVDEYGCELTAEEQKEVDEIAQEITENFFGAKKTEDLKEAAADKGADPAAVVTEKKKPGRPKKQFEDLHEKAQKSNDIPDIVRDVITEKIDLLERMIHTYDESIETLKTDLTQQIADYESRKKDTGVKIKTLMSFLEGAEHGQS